MEMEFHIRLITWSLSRKEREPVLAVLITEMVITYEDVLADANYLPHPAAIDHASR